MTWKTTTTTQHLCQCWPTAFSSGRDSSPFPQLVVTKNRGKNQRLFGSGGENPSTEQWFLGGWPLSSQKPSCDYFFLLLLNKKGTNRACACVTEWMYVYWKLESGGRMTHADSLVRQWGPLEDITLQVWACVCVTVLIEGMSQSNEKEPGQLPPERWRWIWTDCHSGSPHVHITSLPLVAFQVLTAHCADDQCVSVHMRVCVFSGLYLTSV